MYTYSYLIHIDVKGFYCDDFYNIMYIGRYFVCVSQHVREFVN